MQRHKLRRTSKDGKKFLPFGWKRKSYDTRDAILKDLGFKSYAQYLRSNLWKDIRARYLAKDPLCFGCGKPATQIHHKYYCHANLSGDMSRGLFPVCASCHQRIEFKPTGEKVNLGEANRWLFKIRAENFQNSAKKKEQEAVLEELQPGMPPFA